MDFGNRLDSRPPRSLQTVHMWSDHLEHMLIAGPQCFTCFARLQALWLNVSLVARRKVWGGGRGAYGVYRCSGKVLTRQPFPDCECCRYREVLQLFLWVTFISTISMHATHGHTMQGCKHGRDGDGRGPWHSWTGGETKEWLQTSWLNNSSMTNKVRLYCYLLQRKPELSGWVSHVIIKWARPY